MCRALFYNKRISVLQIIVVDGPARAASTKEEKMTKVIFALITVRQLFSLSNVRPSTCPGGGVSWPMKGSQ
jgi:hypothetical protein